MSEVNQAFLRAYLKNRTQSPLNTSSTNISTSSVPAAVQSMPAPTEPVRPNVDARLARPSASLPRQREQPAGQTRRSLETGETLRFDPSHTHPATGPAESGSPQFVAKTTRNQVGQKPAAVPSVTQGVWGPLGVERGMKAMQSVSIPAVVSNGVVAVTQQASQFRGPINQPISPKHHDEFARSNIQYDQVMYVDGLGGPMGPRNASNARPTESTLAEITEPIAFGAGLPTAPNNTVYAKRPSSQVSGGEASTPPPATTNRTLDSYESTSPTFAPAGSPILRRFDPPHGGSAWIEELPKGPPTPTVKKTPNGPDPSSVAPALPPKLSPTTEFRYEPAPPATVATQVARSIETSPVKDSVPSKELASAKDSQSVRESHPAKGASPLPLPVAFAPSWEVDMFFWPEVVKQIEKTHADAFHQIGKHLSLANRDGLKVMAITSGERGVGRSTIAMHMARCAAAYGLRVALVDGDTFCPSLIDQLRLDIQHGWQDCLFENVPLQEVAIHSIGDRITLFPLTTVIPPQQMHANLHRMAKLIKRISTVFDMVFIDASRLNLEQRDLVGVAQESIVDAAIVVVDTELSIKEKVDSAVSILQGMGLSSIGLVENFQS